MKFMAGWITRLLRRQATPTDIARNLVALGFDVEDRDRNFRCVQCRRMKSDNLMVMLPDGSARMPLAQVLKANSAMNRHLSGWCLPCAGRILRSGDVAAEIESRARRLMDQRVKRLEQSGADAQAHPSQTRCPECQATAGYTGGFSATIGAAYYSVLCPCCGWYGYERILGHEGMVIR